jgi:dinuclear metal center YbgI/SA1388 family protein
MTVQDIGNVLDAWAPPDLAESYDNVGLLVGLPQQELTGILINLDMTEAVVEEAVRSGCNMIIAHHPIWFSGRKRLNGEDYVSRTIMKAVKEDVALYAVHTNLDNIRTGVNHRIASKLGLLDTSFLLEKSNGSSQMAGSGMIGRLPRPLAKKAFLQQVREAFDCGGIRYADTAKESVQLVAICGGAGSFLTSAAISKGADAMITADITYHKFFDSENQLLLLDIGHYESEQFTSELIRDFLTEKFPNFAIRLSEVRTNPVNYFP